MSKKLWVILSLAIMGLWTALIWVSTGLVNWLPTVVNDIKQGNPQLLQGIQRMVPQEVSDLGSP